MQKDSPLQMPFFVVLPREAPPKPHIVPMETCARCGESQQLARIKGCVRCLKCGFKADCDGF